MVVEDGPTAVKSAVMLVLILVAGITIVTSLGPSVSSTFRTVDDSMSSWQSPVASSQAPRVGWPSYQPPRVGTTGVPISSRPRTPSFSVPQSFEKEMPMSALQRVKKFLVSEDGPTAVEYAVMLALILVACIAIVRSLGQSVSGTFSTVNDSMATSGTT